MLKDALGNYRGSLEALNRLVAQHEGNAIAYYDRANLKHSSGDHVGAVEDYSESLRIGLRKREELLALGNRAMALSELGHLRQAMRDCTAIIEALPANKGILKTAYLRRAGLNRRIGDRKAASLDIEAAEQLTIR